jgi:hypothetical protein
MTIEVLEALEVVLKTCLEQDSCQQCPMKQFC